MTDDIKNSPVLTAARINAKTTEQACRDLVAIIAVGVAERTIPVSTLRTATRCLDIADALVRELLRDLVAV